MRAKTSPSTRRDDVLSILLEWDGLSRQRVRSIAKRLPIKVVRWLALIHPDNRTREDLYRMSNVEVGEQSVISRNLYIYDSHKPLVKIGNRVAIGANVSLIPESGPTLSRLGLIPEIVDKYAKTAPIVIEDDAWIGAGVIILPGVRIGALSIVGAGSVVTKDVPPGSVVAGVPARVKRSLKVSSAGLRRRRRSFERPVPRCRPRRNRFRRA